MQKNNMCIWVSLITKSGLILLMASNAGVVFAAMPPNLIWQSIYDVSKSYSYTDLVQHECEAQINGFNEGLRDSWYVELTDCYITSGPVPQGSSWQVFFNIEFDFYITSGYYNHGIWNSVIYSIGGCEQPFRYNPGTGDCEVECPIDKPFNWTLRTCQPKPSQCDKTEAPINFVNGFKYKTQLDYQSSSAFPLRIERFYNSLGNLIQTSSGLKEDPNVFPMPSRDLILYTESIKDNYDTPLRRYYLPIYDRYQENREIYNGRSAYKWRTFYDRFLLASFEWNDIDVNEAPTLVKLFRPDGEDEYYELNNTNGIYESKNCSQLTVRRLPGNDEIAPNGWKVMRRGETEFYTPDGQFLSIISSDGLSQFLTYDDTYGTQLIRVDDDFGRSLNFYYEDENHPDRITKITDPEGREYLYEYNERGMLTGVSYPDDTPATKTDNPKRTYLYEDERFPEALTGIIDENGNRYSKYTYDSYGRAVISELSSGISRTTVEYDEANGTRAITNALGSQTAIELGPNQLIVNETRNGSTFGISGDISQSYTYDINGYISSKTDWNGNVTAYTRDAEGRELSRTEGFGTPEARTIATTWNTALNKPLTVTEPQRITTYTYDSAGRLASEKQEAVP